MSQTSIPMVRYGPGGSNIASSEQNVDNSMLMPDFAPQRASQPTMLRTYPPTNQNFTTASSIQIGPGNSEILMPAQLDISPSADMIFPRMPPLGLSVLDQNTPIHREMIVQAMPVDVAPAVHIPIHREMILEDISRYGFAALETSIQQDYVGHLVSNFPNIQDNTVPETTSVAYCRNNPGSRGNTNSCEALRVQPNAEELRCCWQGCTEIRIFSCEATLLRHVKTIHIAPKSKKCPICGYTNGRKDKVRSHFRLVHKR